MSDRRTFLRGLVSLPLIGGGITLIGKPTAAAVPVTKDLMERYIAFLCHEHAAAIVERYPVYREDLSAETDFDTCRKTLLVGGWRRGPDVQSLTIATKPSTRAAVVLSAAGVALI